MKKKKITSVVVACLIMAVTASATVSPAQVNAQAKTGGVDNDATPASTQKDDESFDEMLANALPQIATPITKEEYAINKRFAYRKIIVLNKKGALSAAEFGESKEKMEKYKPVKVSQLTKGSIALSFDTPKTTAAMYELLKIDYPEKDYVVVPDSGNTISFSDDNVYSFNSWGAGADWAKYIMVLKAMENPQGTTITIVDDNEGDYSSCRAIIDELINPLDFVRINVSKIDKKALGDAYIEELCKVLTAAADKGTNVVLLPTNLALSENMEKLIESIDYAIDKGALVVLPVGDNSEEIKVEYTRRNGLVIVCAVDRNGAVYEKSNSGVLVDVAAPGVDISVALNKKEAEVSGSFIASAHVSAIAALLWASGKFDEPAQVKECVIANVSVADGWNKNYGGGVLSVANMLRGITKIEYIDVDYKTIVTTTETISAELGAKLGTKDIPIPREYKLSKPDEQYRVVKNGKWTLEVVDRRVTAVATPTDGKLVISVNDKKIDGDVSGYRINDRYYFEINTLVKIFSQTEKAFIVASDNPLVLATAVKPKKVVDAENTTESAVAEEMKNDTPSADTVAETGKETAEEKDKVATAAKAVFENEDVSFDGVKENFGVYMIDTVRYFSLRNFCDKIGVDVEWIQSESRINIVFKDKA